MAQSLTEDQKQVLQDAEVLVRNHMAAYDPSHDFHHVDRVRKTALRIAKRVEDEKGEGSIDMFVLELAALFHDLYDAKYAQGDDRSTLAVFFESHQGIVSSDQAGRISKIIENVSYSKEVKRIAAGQQTSWHETCLELHCVQDADKLDAIGALGIMRCSAYSMVINRPLYASTSDGELDKNCSIQHYYDKLLKLQGLLRTEEGRRLGTQRQDFMTLFLKQLESEID